MKVKGGFSGELLGLAQRGFSGAPVLAAILFIMVVLAPTSLHADKEGTLVLGAPSSDPSGIPLGEGFKTIKFHSIVSGSAKAPKSLSLDEVDVKGKLIENGKDVATLLDDGKGEDKHAGDYVYTGTLDVEIDVEGERYFRVRAAYPDKTVKSGVSTIGITSFPLDARPSNPKTLVDDPDGGGLRLFADEVLLVLNPGVSSNPDLIKRMATSVGGKVQGVIPPIRMYLVEMPDNKTAMGVKEAIYKLKKNFGKELRRAIPNHEVVSLASDTPQDPAATCSDTIDNTNAGTQSCQWYVQYNRGTTEVVDPVGITKAWDIAGGGSSIYNVATIDKSGIMGTHADLSSKCNQGGAPAGVNPCGQTTAAYDHGTWVAGVLAAKSDFANIAGVAWGTELVSYVPDSSSPSTYTENDAIIDAASRGDVSIINISVKINENINEGILTVVTQEKLVVAAAGNYSTPLSSATESFSCTDAASFNNNPPASLTTVLNASNAEVDVTQNIIAVGAVDIDNNLAKWRKTVYSPTILTKGFCSNYHDFIDIYAPGKDIYTTDIGASGASIYTHASGTSLATPIVSGAAAILWSVQDTGTNDLWGAKGIHDRIVERAKTLCKSGASTPCNETDTNKVVDTTDERLHNKRLLDIVAALGPPTLTPKNQNITLANNCSVYDSRDVVATVSAADIDIATPIPNTYAESLSYSFVDVGGTSVQISGPFSIDSNTGVITVTDTAACPFANNTIPVRVTDLAGLSDTGDLTINVNEPESLCWPPHRGVPYNSSPPTIDGLVQDDVGWRGAHRLTYGNGGTENLAFQGLKKNDNKYLYMSFEVRNDVTFDPNDRIVLYLRGGGGTADDGRRILISPNCIAANCGPSTTVEQYDYTTGIWKNDLGLDGNTSNDGVSNLSVAAKPINGGSAVQWNVEVQVPTTIADGGTGWVDLGQDFLFYFNVIRVANGGTVDTAVQFKWPRNTPEITGVLEDHIFSPGDLGLATTSSTATCNGLWLAWNDIGTNNDPTSKINTISPNKFFAAVHNDTEVGGVPQDVPNVGVRFRIADWGITGTDGEWREIQASPPESRSSPDCAYDPTNSRYNPTCVYIVPGGGEYTFNFDWTVPVELRPQYEDPVKKHQCILVEIDSLSDANIITKSVTRNMNFVHASKFNHAATISAKGYGPPPPGKTHHVFDLHVTTRELPVEVDEKRAAGEREDEVESRFMWELNGYRHTGRFIVINNKKYAITDPVGSFGYIVSHKGSAPVQEWKQELLGAKKVGDNLYRISIRPGEVAKVTTQIVPEEQTDWWRLCILLLIILILFVAIFVIRAVKSSQKGGQ